MTLLWSEENDARPGLPALIVDESDSVIAVVLLDHRDPSCRAMIRRIAGIYGGVRALVGAQILEPGWDDVRYGLVEARVDLLVLDAWQLRILTSD